jgi:hypothetical protein
VAHERGEAAGRVAVRFCETAESADEFRRITVVSRVEEEV